MGELAALNWSDYCDIRYLHIVREGARNQITNRYEIAEHPQNVENLCKQTE